jgi:hypothetical protein
MNRARYVCSLAGAAVLSGCFTAEQNASFHGIAPADAQEVGRFISERTHGQVAYYSRQDDGSIVAWMRPGHDPRFGDIGRGERPFHAYVVRRIGGKWKIVDEPVFVGGGY